MDIGDWATSSTKNNTILHVMQDGSFVNSGPAVYISSTGPNPIMVQVTSSSFVVNKVFV